MQEEAIKLLVTIAHISEKMKSLSEELDKIYSLLSNKKMWEYLDKE